MKKRIKILLISLLTGLTLAGVFSSPVLAMDEPESVTLYNIEIFKDLIVTGDFLAIVPYNIPFTTQPPNNINETFIFSLLSPDASTENGSVLAYPRYTGGYGKGIVSFYFESGMAWDAAYIFRVQENPAFYATPQKWNFSIGPSQYSSDVDQSQGLRAKILDSASELTNEWVVDLLTNSDSGQTVLSTYGELYYINAVPGLQTMSPSLFAVQIESPDYTQRSWSDTFAQSLRTKYAGTILADFMTGYAGLFDMSEDNAMDILSFIIFAIVIIISVWKFKASTIAAFTDGYAVLLLLMLHGGFSMIIAGLIAFLMTLIGGLILFFFRA